MILSTVKREVVAGSFYIVRYVSERQRVCTYVGRVIELREDLGNASMQFYRRLRVRNGRSDNAVAIQEGDIDDVPIENIVQRLNVGESHKRSVTFFENLHKVSE